MAYCKYCGNYVKDEEICNCNSIFSRVTDMWEDANKNHSKKKVIIGTVIIAGIIIAAIIVILFVFLYKNDKEKKTETAKEAAKNYIMASWNSKKGNQYFRYSFTQDVIDQMKKNGEWNDELLNHKELTQNVTDVDIELIRQIEKMNEDQLGFAENFYKSIYKHHDLEYDGLDINKGYEFIVQYEIEYEEDGEYYKDTKMYRICVVKIGNDGWKIIDMSLENLEDYYG